MQPFIVPQPNSQPSDERQADLIKFFLEHNTEIDALWKRTLSPYYPWRKFASSFRAGNFGKFWEEKKVKPEEAWFLLGVRRMFGSTVSDIIDNDSRPFTWAKLPVHEKMLHNFDMHLGGNLATGRGTAGISDQQRYLRQSLIEEAIASSQLEGAATTRERAKKMFAENRKPVSAGEWMIYNNYQTIKKIEDETSSYPLSTEVLRELHVLMTSQTDLEEEKQGRWRKDSDDIIVRRQVGSELYIAHTPPAEDKIEEELAKLIRFANDDGTQGQGDFIHPILKAIMLHFWFAYIHPFCDGNGRLARSLFYWYLLRHKYWVISYIPISTVIKKSPVDYADAFCYSEQYSNDLTYFIDYNLRKLEQALDMFNRHVERVKEKSKAIDRLLPDKDLNERQKQVLHHLLGKPADGVTVTQHSNFHEVSWLTASQDIKKLHSRGYISPQRKGKNIIYYATEKLRDYVD